MSDQLRVVKTLVLGVMAMCSVLIAFGAWDNGAHPLVITIAAAWALFLSAIAIIV